MSLYDHNFAKRSKRYAVSRNLQYLTNLINVFALPFFPEFTAFPICAILLYKAANSHTRFDALTQQGLKLEHLVVQILKHVF